VGPCGGEESLYLILRECRSVDLATPAFVLLEAKENVALDNLEIHEPVEQERFEHPDDPVNELARGSAGIRGDYNGQMIKRRHFLAVSAVPLAVISLVAATASAGPPTVNLANLAAKVLGEKDPTKFKLRNFDETFAKELGLPPDSDGKYVFNELMFPVNGDTKKEDVRILRVRRRQSQADIVFFASNKLGGYAFFYRTSPSGELERVLQVFLSEPYRLIPNGEAQRQFEGEIKFWLDNLGIRAP
jgi:hypothetical protein